MLSNFRGVCLSLVLHSSVGFRLLNSRSPFPSIFSTPPSLNSHAFQTFLHTFRTPFSWAFSGPRLQAYSDPFRSTNLFQPSKLSRLTKQGLVFCKFVIRNYDLRSWNIHGACLQNSLRFLLYPRFDLTAVRVVFI